MSDRFYDRHDNSYDSYEDDYEDRYYGSRLNRSSYSDRHSDRSNRADQARDRDRDRSRARDRGYDSGYRLSQSSDARYRGGASMFDDYYSDEEVDAYRRSAYQSGSERRSSSTGASSASAAGEERRRARREGRRSSEPPATRRSTRRSPDSTERSADAPSSSSSSSSSSERPSVRRSQPVAAVHARTDGREASQASPKRSNRKRNLVIAGVVAAVVVLLGVGMALAYVSGITRNLHEGLDEEVYDVLVPTDLGGEPFYVLLLGTDTSAVRAADPDWGDSVRSDSMILTRIDPANKKVAMISIHRDTLVDLGAYGQQKINAAYEVGGASGAIEAVSKMAGVDIAHYASIDFDAFREMVDALGGVEVDVPMEIDDPQAGGHLDAGLQTLNGEQALILCRSRHSYDYVASDGDIMRAANQRMVLGAIAKKVLSSDLMTIAKTVEALSRYVTTDMSVTDIVGLAQIMKGMDLSTDFYTAMEPTTSAYIDGGWYEFLDEEAWADMIARMDQGLPPVEETIVDGATGVTLSTAGTEAVSNGTRAEDFGYYDYGDGDDDYDEDYYDDEDEW